MKARSAQASRTVAETSALRITLSRHGNGHELPSLRIEYGEGHGGPILKCDRPVNELLSNVVNGLRAGQPPGLIDGARRSVLPRRFGPYPRGSMLHRRHSIRDKNRYRPATERDPLLSNSQRPSSRLALPDKGVRDSPAPRDLACAVTAPNRSGAVG